MAIIEGWKPRIGIGFEYTFGTGVAVGLAPTAAPWNQTMQTGSPKHLPVTNQVDLNPNVNFIDSPKFHGNPERKTVEDGMTELQVGTKSAGTTIEFDLDRRTIVPFLLSCLQEVYELAATPYTKEFINYDRSTDLDFAAKSAESSLLTPYLLSIVKDMGLGATNQRLVSSVVRSMTFNGASGEPIKVSAEIIGAILELDHSTASDTFELPTIDSTPLLFQDCTATINMFAAGAWGGAATIDIINFNLTMTNNAELRFYNSQTASQIVFGRFEATGSITLPFGAETYITAFLANNQFELILTWGTGADEFVITTCGQFTSETVGGDIEQEIELPFTCINLYDVIGVGGTYHPTPNAALGTEAAILFKVEDTLDWGLPGE